MTHCEPPFGTNDHNQVIDVRTKLPYGNPRDNASTAEDVARQMNRAYSMGWYAAQELIRKVLGIE